jgi:hypothetical protein
MRVPLALASAIVVAACAGVSREPLGTEAVTPAYTAAGGQFDDGATVILLVRAFERDGRVAYCGLRTEHSMTGRTLFLKEPVADAATLRLAGDHIASGMKGLGRARYGDDMTGATARCFLTDRPWRTIYGAVEPEIRIPRLSFNEGDGNGFGVPGGFGGSVRFRQMPVHRPLPPPT